MSPVPPAGGGTDSLVLFDPSGTAHSGNAIAGLATAARHAGLGVSVHAPESMRPGDLDPAVRWVPAEVGAVLGTRRTQVAHRRALNAALADTGPTGAFCDLGLGRTVQSRGPRIPATPRSAFVIHQTNHIDPSPDRGRQARTITRNRAVLRDLGERGAAIVVHTAVAQERVAELVPAPQVHCLGWPVAHRDAPCLAPEWRAQPEGRTILFAGSARPQKGLAALLDAARTVEGFDRLVVPGRIRPRLRSLIDTSDPRVELWDRWLSAAEYAEAFARAALVVVPYQRAYLERGTYSSVMAEAMAYGRPLLVSEPLAPLLPPGYAGAVVADAETEAGLAAGLTEALDSLAALEQAAMTEGREHVRREHTYEGYLDGILEACGASAVTTGNGGAR